MPPIDRRTFLKASMAAVAASLVPQATAQSSSKGWRKAYMLNGLKSGEVLDQFQLFRDAGFEGVELISPNDLKLDEILSARDKTGLVIHGVSGRDHWKNPLSSPDPQVVERGLAAVRQSLQDCKAYGATTVLLVPAIVTKDVSYRQACERS